MVVVGITGGIASGKSLVSGEFARRGAAVIAADKLGHEVLLEEDVKAALKNQWGPAVFGPDGEPNRKAIAALVFGHDQQASNNRTFLEELSHPRISARMREQLSELAARGAVDMVVLDAALLFEAGWNEYCDYAVFVDAPREYRLARAKQRGWSAADFSAREQAQMPVDKKRQLADRVIDNSDSVARTAEQVERLCEAFLTDN
jgi:dephospho-CoA kinase